MRGEVLNIDPDGAGLISGDDGKRYSFHTREVAQFIVQAGDRIDFVAIDDHATEILLLASSPTAFRSSDYSRSRKPDPDPGTPWGYFTRCMGKYVDGEGRAPPREYWWFVFFRMLFLLALVLPGLIIIGANEGNDTATGIGGLVVLLAGLFYVVTILPDLAAKIRRLHDIGVTGWAVLLVIIPLGPLVVLFMLVMSSNAYANTYGPVPSSSRQDRGDGRWD